MDWYVIEYLYPKAFKKFTDTMFPNVGILSLSTLMLYDVKKLYQFFDKQGVYLNVEFLLPNQWLFSVSLKKNLKYSSNPSWKVKVIPSYPTS